MRIHICTPDDIKTLAKWNRMLIEDEKADNNMTIVELEQRMIGFLNSEYKAFIFEEEGNRVGYALVNMSKIPLYLQHFFICREERRKGYGKNAFFALLDYLKADEMDLDAYVWNQRGVLFWKSLGFSERCYMMRYKSSDLKYSKTTLNSRQN